VKNKQLIPIYLKNLKVLGRSYHTIREAKYVLRRFVRFLATENADHIEDLNADILAEYQQELYFSLTAKGKPLTLRTQAQTLGVIKGFTKFLKDKDYLIHDPAETIKLPKKPKRLPKVILSPSEVRQLLQAPDIRILI
jgi:integrase/recombinase XerD